MGSRIIRWVIGSHKDRGTEEKVSEVVSDIGSSSEDDS